MVDRPRRVEDLVTPEFWHGRRVFLTGHTGFKGGWLALWLADLHAHVTGYSLAPNTDPNLFQLAGVGQDVQSVIADVRDLRRLSSALADSEPEVVFHLAAQPLVRASYESPVETFETNVMGTVHLLEAVRTVPSVRAVVVVTTDKCYENREWLWGYREDEALGGHDPYSASKACSEIVTAAYRRSYFSNQQGAAIGSARAGNVIGGGDWSADRLVPDMVRAAQSKRPVVVRNPQAVRPWQHVLDPLSGYLVLAETLATDGERGTGAWNFGPSDTDAREVAWIASRFTAQYGSDARWERDPAGHPHEAHLLKLDCSKARALLHWRPKLSLSTALDWTVDWYRSQANGSSARELTLDQIRRYQTLIA